MTWQILTTDLFGVVDDNLYWLLRHSNHFTNSLHIEQVGYHAKHCSNRYDYTLAYENLDIMKSTIYWGIMAKSMALNLVTE